MLAFRPQGKTAQTTCPADRRETLFASGQQLVDIDLMADIPKEFILGRFKNTVQCQCQLNHAQVGSQMSTVVRYDPNDLRPNL